MTAQRLDASTITVNVVDAVAVFPARSVALAARVPDANVPAVDAYCTDHPATLTTDPPRLNSSMKSFL